MKKLLTLILIFSLLISALATLAACGNDAADSTPPNADSNGDADGGNDDGGNDDGGAVEEDVEKTAALKRKVMADWSKYLSAEEYVYTALNWCTYYVDQFYNNPTYQNLMTARTALCAAEQDIASIAIGEYSVTEDEYAYLTALGYDVSACPIILGGLESEIENALGVCTSLTFTLHNNVFSKTLLACEKKYLANVIGINTANVSYVASATEYLLAVFDSETLTSDFSAYVTENLPLISGEFSSTEPNADDAFLAMYETLQMIELFDYSQLGVIGEIKVANDNLSALVEAGDVDAMIAERFEISDMPLLIPYSNAVSPTASTFFYYYSDEDGYVSLPQVPSDLTTPANSVMIMTDNVSEESFNAYSATLVGCGLTLAYDNTGADGTVRIFTYGDSTVSFSYESGSLAIIISGGDVAAVSDWYISA